MSESIHIDAEFASRLDPLSSDERARLKKQIAAAGEVIDPILYWQEQNTIVDGHHRLEIYNELVAEGVSIKAPKYRALQFASRDDALNFIDEHALAKRSLDASQRKIIVGRIFNFEKRRRGGDRKSKHQVDALILKKTSACIAKKVGIGSASVERNGKRAEVYDAVVAEKGAASAEARVAKTAPQSVIDAALSSNKGGPMSELLVKAKARSDRKRKKAIKAAKPPMKDQTFYQAPEDSFTNMLNAVKDAGPLPAEEFWKRIGGAGNQECFKLLVSHSHYMHLQVDADRIELFVDEREKELCTAIERQLHRMKAWSRTQNRFKFDVDMYKKTIQDLYDLVHKASSYTP